MTGVLLLKLKDPVWRQLQSDDASTVCTKDIYIVFILSKITQPYLQMSGLSSCSFCISPAVLSAIMGMVSCALLVSVLPPVRMLSKITTVRVAAKALSICRQESSSKKAVAGKQEQESRSRKAASVAGALHGPVLGLQPLHLIYSISTPHTHNGGHVRHNKSGIAHRGYNQVEEPTGTPHQVESHFSTGGRVPP